jgi:dGTPase
MDATNVHVQRLTEAVKRAIAVGAADLREVCMLCSGADPALVDEALRSMKVGSDELAEHRHKATMRAARARRLASDILASLPGANPEHSQWWFTLNCIERLSERVFLRSGAKNIVLLGASSLAAYYADRFESACHTLDIDKDVIAVIGAAAKTSSAMVYDVADSPPSLSPPPTAAVVDPPWYPPFMEHFLIRAAQMIPIGGFTFSTLPGELTRPGVLHQRDELIARAAGHGLSLREVHEAAVEYSVPDFERTALRSFEKLQTKPWRYADLAVFEKLKEPAEPPSITSSKSLSVYSRGHEKKFRLFFDSARIVPGLASPIEPVPEYSATVSRRIMPRDTIALWTSSNIAFRVRDAALAISALDCWQSKKTISEALAAVKDDSVRLFLETLTKKLQLPADTAGVRRTPEEITKRRDNMLSDWAEREPAGVESDGYRPQFARDRDRILWSNGVRQLSNKTQVFSTSESDYVRQRLTHSIEVMQLASTIGSSFGLDRDLIEAGALAHDIGHTPFGHAGEVALDKTLRKVAPSINGFNHYEHGLDVVTWLEDAYRHPANGEKFGLALTPAVLECILKHTFCQAGKPVGQKELLAVSKHRTVIPPGQCHLEGQAVRAADKISYLISDIEDGLRLGAITLEDLRVCRLFWHPPIDLTHALTEDPLAAFVAQRRSVIAVLMQDLIDETAQRLASYSSRAMVRSCKGYTIDHSASIAEELTEVWVRVQSAKLHNDPRVIATNRRAAHVVNRLLMIFTLRPTLIDKEFRAVHESLRQTPYIRWYRDQVSSRGFAIPDNVAGDLALDFMIGHDTSPPPEIDDLVQAKDYVASMTDRRALSVYTKIFGVAEKQS